MPVNILTPFQERILSVLFQGGIGALGYYLTGGTALAAYYLHHRRSEDLDFFTRSADHSGERSILFSDILTAADIVVSAQDVWGDHIRFTVYPSNDPADTVKLDFSRDAGAMMASPRVDGNIIVDSFEDIAVNKVCAIRGRDPSEPKDFVDLHFILQDSTYTIDFLLSRAKEKEQVFEDDFGIFEFATRLLDPDTSRFEASFSIKMNMLLIRKVDIATLRERFIPVANDLIDRYRPRRS